MLIVRRSSSMLIVGSANRAGDAAQISASGDELHPCAKSTDAKADVIDSSPRVVCNPSVHGA